MNVLLKIGLYFVALGGLLLILAVTFDHNAMGRSHWFVGEMGIGGLVIGSAFLLIGVVSTLRRTRPEDRP